MKTTYIRRLCRQPLLLASIAALVCLVYFEGSSAGIQGSGRFAIVSYGRITAFGSIFVNDVEYSLANAQIDLDGRSAAQPQLRIGQIVAVQANLNPSGKTGTATSVAFTGDVLGPVAEVDSASRSFTVLGQTIRIADATVFGEGIQPAAGGSLQQGTIVEVSAFVDAAGALVASRIDLQGNGMPLQVKGTVETLDTGAKTFRINDLTIDYSGVGAIGKLKLANGVTAVVRSDEFPAGNTLHATQLQVATGVGGLPNEHGQLEGIITSFNSNTEFYVGDQLVTTNSSTHFILHGQTLAPDLDVQVHGVFSTSGALVADKVQEK